VVHSADAVYINNGLVTFPPQIDAITVINNGTFSFTSNLTTYPFDTSNTQNFTNNGTMRGGVGFQFDNAPASAGVRKPLANFRNRLTGSITALDVRQVLSSLNGQPFDIDLLDSSQLLVSATNIINEGILTAGAAGIVRLVGTNVNLARSGVLIEALTGLGSYNVSIFTNFYIPDVGIYDLYWGQSNQVANSRNIIRQPAGGPLIVTSPSSLVDFPPPRPPIIRFFGNVIVQLVNPVGDFYTNTLATTNLMITNMTGSATTTNVPLTNVVQAVFIGLPQGGADWGVRFFPSEDPQNPFNTVSVGISVSETNVVTVGQDAITLYLTDTLASTTNRGILTNFTTSTTARPSNYNMERLEPLEFFLGFPGNGPFQTNLLYQSDFASAIITNEYAAYSAFVDNIASRPPNIPAGTPTNLPGRIEIRADSLDLTRTRFRANGLLDIQTKHLISSSNTIVDSENLSFSLGSTNGNLKIQSLAKDVVSRLQGTNYVWSGFWTNFQNMLIENYVQDTVNTNLYILTPITNVVEYRIYAMIYDTTQMRSLVPVIVNDFLTHSTNVVVNDAMTVVQSLLIDGESFTLNGSITLSNKFYIDNRGDVIIISLNDWLGTNAPNLKFFTNNGTLNIPSEGHFGDDLPKPYSTFVNNGIIDAFGQTIHSDYVEITGQHFTTASLVITAGSGKIEGGTLNSGGDVQFFANDLRFNHATIQTGARLDFSVTNSLSDAGFASGNSFSTTDGFRLLRKPVFGDLLGTTFNSIAPPFAEVDHVWAAADRGASAAGFDNNQAIGKLILSPGQFEAQFPPLFFFEGVGGGNALYVDLLDLSQLSDFQNEIMINPDLVIYYAAAKLSFTPPTTNGAPQLPEEYLDGQFGGHLRWVRDFAGPNSSVDVIINGLTVRVNRALRNSKIIDSDGDGVPNFFDTDPFNAGSSFALSGAMLKTNLPPAKAFLISWPAVANGIYRVEFTTNSSLGNWQLLCRCTNNAPTNRVISVWDTNISSAADRRFYRVGYGP
jgi:hypothetical protein